MSGFDILSHFSSAHFQPPTVNPHQRAVVIFIFVHSVAARFENSQGCIWSINFHGVVGWQAMNNDPDGPTLQPQLHNFFIQPCDGKFCIVGQADRVDSCIDLCPSPDFGVNTIAVCNDKVEGC